MNIENSLPNIVFWVVLVVAIVGLVSRFAKDCKVSLSASTFATIGKVAVMIVLAILLWSWLSPLGIVPCLVGIGIIAILIFTGLLFKLIVWLLKKLKKLFAQAWKKCPWWGKTILVVAVIVAVLLIIL